MNKKVIFMREINFQSCEHADIPSDNHVISKKSIPNRNRLIVKNTKHIVCITPLSRYESLCQISGPWQNPIRSISRLIRVESK
jgi:hypothetical protein